MRADKFDFDYDIAFYGYDGFLYSVGYLAGLNLVRLFRFAFVDKAPRTGAAALSRLWK